MKKILLSIVAVIVLSVALYCATQGPQFWCNPFQRLLPIQAPVSRVPVLISEPGVLLSPLSLQVLPPAEDVP